MALWAAVTTKLYEALLAQKRLPKSEPKPKPERGQLTKLTVNQQSKPNQTRNAHTETLYSMYCSGTRGRFWFFFCVGWGEREKFENKLQKNAHYNLTITEQNKAN